MLGAILTATMRDRIPHANRARTTAVSLTAEWWAPSSQPGGASPREPRTNHGCEPDGRMLGAILTAAMRDRIPHANREGRIAFADNMQTLERR
jgi:hypothetical protein